MSSTRSGSNALLSGILVGFWLAGMLLLRSELWIPWVVLLVAIGLSCWFMLR